MAWCRVVVVTLLLICCGVVPALATHIAGGELFYERIGAGTNPNTIRYRVTMRLFRECASQGQSLDGETVTVGIYSTADLSLVQSLPLAGTPIRTIRNTPGAIPCLNNDPNLCYQIREFSAEVDLAINAGGYTMAWLRFTRTSLDNAIVTPSQTGATFIVTIPGANVLPQGFNSSAQFAIKDTSIVCRDKAFTLPFFATDPDGDSLVYRFAAALDGQGSANPPNPPPPATLQLIPLNYTGVYSPTQPLGPRATINPRTGVISGVAPATAGKFVICVVVEEWRGGVKISEARKDFIMTIGDCDFAEANLNPNKRTFCETFNYNFQNGSTSSSILAYHWDFGVPNRTNDTSNLPTPTFTFPDTGIYKIMLTVFGPNGCNATDSLELGIYPGYNTNFDVTGTCFQNPYEFRDRTVSPYGVVNYWRWDFGNNAATNDTSRIANPNYTYPNAANYVVTLVTRNTRGCEDSHTFNLAVNDKPPLNLPFRDTLICNVDTLPLIAQGSGVFTWSPNNRIINRTTANPLVFPRDTTVYVVTLNNNGCIATDSIRVNVLPFISVALPPDTTLCQTDSFRINTISEALRYSWTPSNGLSSASAKNPMASPSNTVTYRVIANLGDFCADTAFMTVKVAPYPQVSVSVDTFICSGKSVTLQGNIVGSAYSWSPTIGLTNPNTLTPTATPTVTTAYVLSVTDTVGCPKPVSDTILVRVIPPVRAFAGNDTAVVGSQPLQLQATGGVRYLWTPTWPLNQADISNPIAIIPVIYDSILFRVRAFSAEGCEGVDEVMVKVFQTDPEIFVPTGFTPNADGRNDILRPIPIGVSKITYFRVYNRLGNVVYQTSEMGRGWDGMYNGVAQPSGTYVWTVEGIDFTGKVIVKKGTVVLIR